MNGRERAAFLFQAVPGSTMNCASHPATDAEFGISCIDDGVYVGLVCDISLHAFNGHTVKLSFGHEKHILMRTRSNHPACAAIFQCRLSFECLKFGMGLVGVYRAPPFDVHIEQLYALSKLTVKLRI
jgi:hypothetical protein